MTTRLFRRGPAGLAVTTLLALAACAPTVKIEAPDKPIEINLNVRIEQEVRVKLERDVDKAIASDPALFGLPPAAVKEAAEKSGKEKTK
ncbi:YnbE family lipoprotein [Azospirillum thermophilum]|uniref:YnbE family lipoprotein n=1 Tax=Azospirillum thermophilum TaxID=2202148 RepID=A0A2S2CRI3_9PROT|nr:YnbE family lipoprotein [Azospirillum thermophilum]AWK86980.1 YnbE family lipoprotein [Azospirillum thermophilum]